MKNKKIILIENNLQAKEYLKRKEEFKDAVPITFDFPSEEILSNANVNFKTEEEYETETIYKGIYNISLKNTNEICEKIKIYYRGVDLFQLFYMDLFRFLGISRRHLRLLEKIKKIENPKKVMTFRNKYNFDINENICSRIAKEVFKENLKEIEYFEKHGTEPLSFKIGKFAQIFFSKIKLFFLNKNDNKIFFDDSKVRFESLLKELLKDKKNKLFRCKDHLQKSFFVGRNYIPFYEFTQEKIKDQKRLLKDIKKFKENHRDFIFLGNLNIEKNFLPFLKEWIDYYLKFKFLEISYIINHIIKLFEKNKIDIIVLFADSEPFEKAFAQIGKSFKIPSMVIMHGLVDYGVTPGFIPLSADYILVYGDKSKIRLNKLGVSEDRIIVTGSQQFDKPFSTKKIKKNKKEIVFITSCPSSHNFFPEYSFTKKRLKKFFRELYSTLKKFPEYKLIIKGRKEWDMNNLPNMIAKQEKFKNLKFVVDIDPAKLLSDAEIVIINKTTMVFDALILNKPVISFWFKDMNKFGGYGKQNVIKVVYTPQQLERAIKNSQNQTKKDNLQTKKYLEKELYKLDGKSSRRIADFIESLIAKKKRR